jgi:hypothetical protein
MADVMYRGAGQIAERVLGANNEQNRRVIYRWASELPADQVPVKLRKSGRTLFCWESDISGAAAKPAA